MDIDYILTKINNAVDALYRRSGKTPPMADLELQRRGLRDVFIHAVLRANGSIIATSSTEQTFPTASAALYSLLGALEAEFAKLGEAG